MNRLRSAPLRSISRLAILLALALLLIGADRPPGLGDVREVRTWSYPGYTRVVLELSRDVSVAQDDLVRLAANARAGRPERLYLDVPGIWVGTRYDEGIEVGDGLLSAVRLGQNTLDRTRLVIDLARYSDHRVFTLPSPARIVIDVYGDRKPARDADDRGGRLPQELRRVNTIVVDPGHGGRDPGATGVGGLREKDVNLAIARQLAKRLEERGFEVVLTRDDDRTLDLEERSVIAESAGGDVFISIHANASRRKAARGIEIYTLDQNHERHSLDVAARENGVPAARLDPLQRALAQLRAGEVATHSERLASLVHERVMHGAKERDHTLPDLGLKKGPFYVLFMSSMSALLVETGFVTNERDAGLLRSREYQHLLADRIAEGVERYRRQIELGVAARAGGLGGDR
ncbi:MAG: N-acetylmuramoyl-L-alanine amidase [Spirochaetaceae bacterium]|nr:N-acetylmuramoyl-L-alanine amidase [Myxococcales bacterium]MCB9722981.1 N-acetylmuramoyl-L-alanine amidase [Spirochaetaceae bacterium]HPG26937.1 N-acetylmuramoyl-L-alanine amidase [Myxococcota bacterium]